LDPELLFDLSAVGTRCESAFKIPASKFELRITKDAKLIKLVSSLSEHFKRLEDLSCPDSDPFGKMPGC
jgi:hypothetical protein